MSTNSRIGIEKEDGTIESIYVHWDGYLEGVGATLLRSYTEKEKVEKLIALGALSSLFDEVDIPDGTVHSFDNPAVNITVAYHRDRGEPITPSRTNYSRDSYLKSDLGEFGYLFTKENEWLYAYQKRKEYIPLDAAINDDF
jgi:hypothetical protein